MGGSQSNSAKGQLLKYTDAGSSGTLIWSEFLPQNEGPPPVYAIAVNGTHVYAAGIFRTTMGIGNTSITSRYPQSNVWVARFDDLGSASSFAWVQQAGSQPTGAYSQDDARATSLALGGAGMIYVGGSAYPAAVFGSLTLGANATGFLATIQDGTALPTAAPVPLADLRLFPNPAHGTVTIQLPAISGATMATLTILDALGRTLRTQTAATNAKVEPDLTGLPPGIYAVRVQADSGTATRRLVAE